MVTHHADLGYLHWRRGIDPRPDFDRAVRAYHELRAFMAEHGVQGHRPDIYAYPMLFLMGVQVPAEDIPGVKPPPRKLRHPRYELDLARILHGHPMSPAADDFLQRCLLECDALPDRVFRTYFQLLGVFPSDLSQDALISEAEQNWKRRRGNFYFQHPWAAGHRDSNDLYVDIWLEAVLAKLGRPVRWPVGGAA